MKIELGTENTEAEALIPPAKPDGSRIGVNYADAYIKSISHTLGDGREVSCKRRGLKLTFSIGDTKGEAVMRRIEHGPDAKNILRKALEDAARNADAAFTVEDGVMFLEI